MTGYARRGPAGSRQLRPIKKAERPLSILRIKKLSLRYEDKQILREVYLRIAAGERVGLAGANGTGKTSLFRLILEQVDATAGSAAAHAAETPGLREIEGDVELDHGLRVGYFSQFSKLDGQRSIQAILEAAFSEVQAWERELSEIEQALGDDPDPASLDSLLLRQGELFEQMTDREGWSYGLKIDTVLTKLGFDATHRARPVEQLSDGWRNRASLAQILIEQPELLLLDEPTNYLDVEGIRFLESWISRISSAVLVVSHDRQFLDAIVNRIVEIENYRLHDYPGAYDAYLRAKTKLAGQLTKEYRHEEELLLFETATITKRKAAKAATKGTSSAKTARKVSKIRKGGITPTVDNVVSAVYAKLHLPTELAEFEGLTASREGRTLFEDVSFSLKRRDRVVILGRNGCGKTTLLDVLTERLEPDGGEVRWRPGVRFSEFTAVLDELEPNARLLRCAMAAPAQFLESHEMPSQKNVMRFLRMLGFSEPDLQLRVGTLSGGERARLALCWCLTSGPAVIVLDEPTNHLDMRSAQIMERALVKFPGAVLAVSHDRFFIDKVATSLLVFEDGRVNRYSGGWSIYQRRVAQAAS
jgi:sulfate-transporting ATPase